MFWRKEPFNINVHVGHAHGSTFVTLVDDYACPVCPDVSCYMYHWGGSVNSRKLWAYDLRFVLNYFRSLPQSIDVSARVRAGEFFSRAELSAFVSVAQFRKGGDFSNVVSIKPFSDKALENAIHASTVARERVTASTAKRRIHRLKHFIHYLNGVYHADNLPPEAVEHRYNFVCEYLEEAQKSLRDFNRTCVVPNKSVLPDEVFFRMLDIIQPTSPDNPFKHSKLRNYLIIALFIETGLRRGAVAKLKIEDCQFFGAFNEILIARRPDDNEDPRLHRPSQKTKAHRAFVSPELMRELQRYIEGTRSRYPAANTHDMIFISEMNHKGTAGQPLTLSAYQTLFESLSKALGYNVHPHLLRHKWNEIFSDKADALGLHGEEVEKLRKYAMGWSRTSEMGAVYNEFKIAESVRDIQQQRQEQIMNTESDL